MRKTFSLVLLLIGVACALNCSAQPQVSSQRPDQPDETQGFPCKTGSAFYFPNGLLQRCAISHEIAFGEARLPAGSIIVLLPDGKPNYVMLSHPSAVAGVKCMGGGLLGVAEGATTAFYPSGKLKQCYLAGNQTVQGVPCMNGGIFGDAFSGVKFYETGKLESCNLSKRFYLLRRKTRFSQAP